MRSTGGKSSAMAQVRQYDGAYRPEPAALVWALVQNGQPTHFSPNTTFQQTREEIPRLTRSPNWIRLRRLAAAMPFRAAI